MKPSDQSPEPAEQIIARAARDEEYRKRLIANPKRAITEVTGSEVPANIDVKVVQETPTTVYLVLPNLTQAGAGELSDAELQNVAGGAAACRFLTIGKPRPACPCSSLSVCPKN